MQEVLMTSIDEKLFAVHIVKENIELIWIWFQERDGTGIPVILSLQEFGDACDSRRAHSSLPFYLFVGCSRLKHASDTEAVREFSNLPFGEEIPDESEDFGLVFHERKCETDILTGISEFCFHFALV